MIKPGVFGTVTAVNGNIITVTSTIEWVQDLLMVQQLLPPPLL